VRQCRLARAAAEVARTSFLYLLHVRWTSRTTHTHHRETQRSPRVRVVLPAFCDTSPRSVVQRFRPATTCAAPDVIAHVSAYTPLTACAHAARSDAHTAHP
jgi:hypothetical protein